MIKRHTWPLFAVLVIISVSVANISSSSAVVTSSRRAKVDVLARGRAKPAVHLLAPGSHVLTLKIQSRSRQVIVVVPKSTAAKNRSLVLVYPGALDTASGAASSTDFVSVGEHDGFVVAFLQGYHDSWNDGLNDTPAFAANVNDVAFTSAVIRKIEDLVVFNHSRITAVGFSNGALMVHFLGCHLANLVTQVVPVEGEMPTTMSTNCHPSRAVSVYEVHGTSDASFPYGGGRFKSVFGGGGTVLSAQASVATWASLDHCATSPTHSTPSASTTLVHYDGCSSRATVSLLTIIGGTHEWPSDIGLVVAGAL